MSKYKLFLKFFYKCSWIPRLSFLVWSVSCIIAFVLCIFDLTQIPSATLSNSLFNFGLFTLFLFIIHPIDKVDSEAGEPSKASEE